MPSGDWPIPRGIEPRPIGIRPNPHGDGALPQGISANPYGKLDTPRGEVDINDRDRRLPHSPLEIPSRSGHATRYASDKIRDLPGA